MDDVVVTLGTDTYTETTTKGNVIGAVRNDTLATLVDTDNEIAPLQVNANGSLYVNVENLGGTHVDDATFTAATDDGVPAFGMFNDSTPDSVGEGDAGIVRMSANRNLYGTIRDAAGNERGVNVDASGNLNTILAANTGVDIGDVDVTSVIPGTGATNLGKTEDVAHNSGDVGVMSLGVRNDTLAPLAGSDGDYAPHQVNADGSLYVHSSNKVSTDNSTTSTLANDAVYTGTGENVSQFSVVTITIDSSHDSATDGMTFEFSTDNSNWDDVYTFTYTAADGARRFQLPVTAQYFRVVYTNGGTSQTHFRVQTLIHDNTTLTTIHRLVDNTDPDRSAQLVKASIIAQAAGSGDFVPVQATAAGNLKTSTEEISNGLDIGAGNAGTETQRVSISTDDVNLSAIKTATELIDNPIVAHDAAISGATGVNVIGARAVASVEGQTETAAADASQVNATLSGNLITQSQVAPEELVNYHVVNTAGTELAVTGLDAGGATIFNYITSVMVHNAHASTNGFIQLLDGSAGTPFATFPAPAGGGTVINFSPPKKQTTANTALFWDASAAITTLYVTIQGYQGQG